MKSSSCLKVFLDRNPDKYHQHRLFKQKVQALNIIFINLQIKLVIDEFCCYILVNKNTKNASENICKNIHPFSTPVRNKMLVNFITYSIKT